MPSESIVQVEDTSGSPIMDDAVDVAPVAKDDTPTNAVQPIFEALEITKAEQYPTSAVTSGAEHAVFQPTETAKETLLGGGHTSEAVTSISSQGLFAPVSTTSSAPITASCDTCSVTPITSGGLQQKSIKDAMEGPAEDARKDTDGPEIELTSSPTEDKPHSRHQGTVEVRDHPTRQGDSGPSQSSGAVTPLGRGMYGSKVAPKHSESLETTRPGSFPEKLPILPRAPRRFPNDPRRDGERIEPREEARSLQSELRKVKQDLEIERKTRKAAMEEFEANIRRNYETALEQTISEIFQQRVVIVKQTVEVKKQELDVQAREDLVRQTEQILALGHKHFAGADDQDLKTFTDINQELIRAQVAHELAQHDRNANRDLALRTEELNAEAIEALEAKLKADIEYDIAMRVANVEYDRGFADGKSIGKIEGNDELRSACYNEGYAACHEYEVRMKQFRAGTLSKDSPEMAFLFDPEHPDHPFNRGLQIGRRMPLKATLFTPTHGDIVSGRQAQMTGRLNDATAHPLSPEKPPFLRNASTEDKKTNDFSGLGAPEEGSRRAPPPHLQAQTPLTLKPIGSNSVDNTTTGRERSGSSGFNSTPGFGSARRLLRQTQLNDEDEKAHKADEQIDLIDLY
ncbi:hypothetical protein N0V90_001856 [Kalmusia sp. IMI 367209]|nr:hypothetical protein N0V90_001856 [Kalmusia sp. IMI 367209]